MAESTQPEAVPAALIPATQVARDAPARLSPNGLHFATFGEMNTAAADLERVVQAVPASIAHALTLKTYYFVPLAIAESRTHAGSQPPPHRTAREATLVAPAYTPEHAEIAICHRNVDLETDGKPTREGVFISTRLLSDRFSLAFELFINVGHALVDIAGVPDAFTELAWGQVVADIRGETSQDAWEFRALARTMHEGKPRIDEKSKSDYLEAAFADSIAIYQLSLAVDFDYSELREREYPLLAPQALAERLRLVARLFPPNPNYEFAIRYRRRA